MKFTTKKVAVVLGAGAIAVAGSGMAFAYWTTAASGSGTAVAGTNANDAALVITESTTPSGLVPGGAAQTVKVTIKNIASYSQAVGAITATPTFPPACDASNWTVSGVTNTGAILAAGATSPEISVATVALKDLGVGTPQDGCKGATVQFAFAG